MLAMKADVILLHLLNPLFYIEENPLEIRAESSLARPFDYSPEKGEMIYCFELDAAQSGLFEPDRTFFPGSLVSFGKAAEPVAVDGKTANGNVQDSDGQKRVFRELARGDYLFTQVRDIPGREEIVDLAIEVQQEGLWQRLKPGGKYYLRYVFEDNSPVTQIFRQYIPELFGNFSF